ncbi:transmembrane protein 45B [Elysia marginata]|uniref:Transmembrane protein 45B n=1 Tax=Elysia marginata TaxID=1093978 RepID=A0AAV4IHW5_9GAST|nr:transmembrane protein 45B [Elysia marginata]
MEHHHAHSHDFHSVAVDASSLNYSELPPLNTTTQGPPGTILGHVIASVSWFTIGFLYVALALQRHYTCRQRGAKYVSSVEFPLEFLSGRLANLPLVALIKTLGATTFLVSALLDEFEPGSMEEAGQWQHDLMSIAFIVSGGIDILISCTRARRLIPDGADYLAFFATFFIETQQLVIHLDTRDPVDVRLHQLMAITAAAGGVSLVGEAVFRRHVMLAVIRGFSIMLQGTWVMNLMVVLYHPGREEPFWNPSSHASVTLVSLMFAWHVIFNAVLALATNLFFVWFYSRPQYKVVPHSDTCGEQAGG